LCNEFENHQHLTKYGFKKGITMIKRLLNYFFLASAAFQFAGCAVISVVTSQDSAPIPKISAGGIKIMYLATELTAVPKTGLFGSHNPALGGSYGGSFDEFSSATSRMFATFHNTIGPSLQSESRKVESVITAASEMRSGSSPMTFSAASATWPTLVIAPKSVVRSCSGGYCSLRYKLSLQLFNAETKTLLWSDEIEQSALAKVTENSPPQGYVNFAQGVASYLSKKLNA
jgi:hypothetical protein